MRTFRVILLLVLVGLGGLAADGKFFAGERVPVGLPYQRAVIVHRDGVETLLVQSRWQLGEPVDRLGWVVPAPAVPELGSMDPELAGNVFRSLWTQARPRIIEPLPWLMGAWFALTLICLVVAVVRRLFGKTGGLFEGIVGRCAIYSFIFLVIAVFTLPTLATIRAKGVDVLDRRRVGVYDVSVVSAAEAGPLIAWFEESGFAYDEDDLAVVQDYLDRGWCFVAARIHADAAEEEVLGHDGASAPLILRFPCEQPVYPLALTGSGGSETEIHLYVFAERRCAPPPGMQLRYAGAADPDELMGETWRTDEDAAALADFGEGSWMLTRFTGRLSAEQMAADWSLAADATDEAHRETHWRW